MRISKMWSLVGAGALVFATAMGCAQKTVHDVMADPGRYANKRVSVTGNVVESFSLAGRGFYRIDDDTGRLWVFSTRGVPRTGTRVSVKGSVHDGFDITSLDFLVKLPEPVRERIESGLLLVESSHKAKSL